MVTVQRFAIDAQGKHRPMKGKVLIMPRRKVTARLRHAKRCQVVRFAPLRKLWRGMTI